MSEGSFIESVVEDAALAWLESLGYAIKHGDRTYRLVAMPSPSPSLSGRGIITLR